MVVNNSGMVEQRVLKIERAIGNKWMVSEGLKQGDRVIIEGLQRIQAGSPAKVATSSAKTGAVSPSDKTIPVAAK